MANKWHIVALGVVVAQGMSAMENKTNSPRLSCSTEARNEVVAVTLKSSFERKKSGSLEKKEVGRKIEKNDTSNIFYETPCGGGGVYYLNNDKGHGHHNDYMKPWTPDYFPH